MAKCPNPNCEQGWMLCAVEWFNGNASVYMPCPTCGGAYGEVSCCAGPEGAGTELPTDPNERDEK